MMDDVDTFMAIICSVWEVWEIIKQAIPKDMYYATTSPFCAGVCVWGGATYIYICNRLLWPS